MLRFIVKRLLQSVLTVIGVITGSSLTYRATPEHVASVTQRA